MAAITLAAYLLPAGLGDASLANLPPEAGLYACLFGALGLLRAYRLTLNFYLGAEPGRAAKQRQPVSRPASGSWLLEQTLPGLPDDTAGLALATFRSLLRAPELKMAAKATIRNEVSKGAS